LLRRPRSSVEQSRGHTYDAVVAVSDDLVRALRVCAPRSERAGATDLTTYVTIESDLER